MFFQALESLRHYRLHAALSGFGVAVGVAASIVLIAFARGFQNQLEQQLRHDGASSLVVRQVSESELSWLSTFRDAARRELADASPQITDISIEQPLGQRTIAGDTTMGLSVSAVEPDALSIRSLRMTMGRWFTWPDVRTDSAVAVMGPWACRLLFPSGACVGRRVSIDERPFTVIGVLDWVGATSGVGRSSRDREIYLPLTGATQDLETSGLPAFVMVGLDSVGSAETVERQLRVHLLRRGVSSRDVEVRSSAERQQGAARVWLAAQVFGFVAGGIGIAIGVIGVMNVMFLSVKSRSVEIGIRRAVGARKQQVFAQFLWEALLATGVNGLVGVLLGTGICRAAALLAVPGVPAPVISPSAMTVVALLIAGAGVVAGVGPARRAASVFPSEALRTE